MIQGHIKNLLYAYDCVIIPEFGGLITHYTSAKIHPVKHTFSPPSKRIAFNEQLKVNDGLLISTLAKQQQWPLTQAQQAVSEFVHELKEQLLHQHRFELSDVGVFRYNAERKLVFENIMNENFLDASFGLPELVSKPIAGKESLVLRGKYKDQTLQPQQENKKVVGRFRKLYRIGASLVLGGVAITGVYLFSLQNNAALSSLNPFSLMATQETVQPIPVQETLEIEAEYPVYSDASAAALEAELDTEQTEGWENQERTEAVISGSFSENETKTNATEEVVPAKIATPMAKVVPENKPAVTSVIPVAPKKETPAPAVIAKTPVKAETNSVITQKTGRYYVIMGVFTQEGYAERNVKQLTKKGFDAKIITPSQDRKMRDRVSVADFASAQEAHAALPELRKKFNNELWVFNF